MTMGRLDVTTFFAFVIHLTSTRSQGSTGLTNGIMRDHRVFHMSPLISWTSMQIKVDSLASFTLSRIPDPRSCL